jgi:hypothetical protein
LAAWWAASWPKGKSLSSFSRCAPRTASGASRFAATCRPHARVVGTLALAPALLPGDSFWCGTGSLRTSHLVAKVAKFTLRRRWISSSQVDWLTQSSGLPPPLSCQLPLRAHCRCTLFFSSWKDMPKELEEVRRWLRECYDDISCFLLPDPGKKVKKTEFQGQLSMLEDDFCTQLKEFVPCVLAVCPAPCHPPSRSSGGRWRDRGPLPNGVGAPRLQPEALVLKRVAGEEVTASGLRNYLEAYVKAFNGGDLPQAGAACAVPSVPEFPFFALLACAHTQPCYRFKPSSTPQPRCTSRTCGRQRWSATMRPCARWQAQGDLL